MARLNLVLLLIAIGCALGVVTAQHHARKLFVALEKEHERTKQLEIEYGQLIRSAITGADIATIPPAVLFGLAKHPLTDKGIEQFLADWEKVKNR